MSKLNPAGPGPITFAAAAPGEESAQLDWLPACTPSPSPFEEGGVDAALTVDCANAAIVVEIRQLKKRSR